jgi:hypothetical protein
MDQNDKNTIQRLEQNQEKMLKEIQSLKRTLAEVLEYVKAISAGR